MTYAEKLKDPRWQKKRLEVFERDGWRCQTCDDDKTTLAVHHKKYVSGLEPWDYELRLLITLCERCHDMLYIPKVPEVATPPASGKVIWYDHQPLESGNADILFVLDCLAKGEADGGINWPDRNWQVLSRALAHPDMPPLKNHFEWWIENCCLDDPGTFDREPTREELEQSFASFSSNIASINPRLIVCLGITPFKFLTGLNHPISRVRGKTFTSSRSVFPITAVFHPAYLLRADGSEFEKFQADLLAIGNSLRPSLTP